MGWMMRTFGSSVGSKGVMAVTGLLLFGFLVGHMSGNLLVYAGADAFNTYAANMQSLGALLWMMRGGLLVVFTVHLASGIKLWNANRAARPEKYRHSDTVQASIASRTMILTGMMILFFVLYHLSHFTLHWIQPQNIMLDEQGRHDAYKMLVLGFQNPLVSGFYIVAMICLGMHLSHGLRSVWQSLGCNHPNLNIFTRCLLPAFGWLIVMGFISLPVSVLLGCVRIEGGV